MGWYHDGMGWGGWLLMTLTMVVFWAAVVLAVMALFRDAEPTRQRRTPVQLLDERFARGEIDVTEYRRRRDALVESSTPDTDPSWRDSNARDAMRRSW